MDHPARLHIVAPCWRCPWRRPDSTWWGPASATTRDGARRALAVLAPGRAGAVVVVLVALAVVAVLAVLLAGGQDPAWAPLPEPTLPS